MGLNKVLHIDQYMYIAFFLLSSSLVVFESEMEGIPKVGDIDDEDNLLRTKIKLTKNEYNATIRNKLEYNRLKVIKRHLDSQNDLNGCKMRTSVQDTKKWLNENQTVICNIDEFFYNRKVRSTD